MSPTAFTENRVDWIDYAKGMCIILVVMMHSTLGVEKAMGVTGHVNSFIEWARPFRMPDFFLISGLFLSRRIASPWRSYLDSKVAHFAYFYILWMSIQFAFKGFGTYREAGLAGVAQQYALGFIEPFGTLWFIYLLAVFFVVVKATRRVPPMLVFIVAALLEMAPIETGLLLVDEFASRFVYFFAGYWLAGSIFQSTRIMWSRHALALMAMLYIWATGHSLVMVAGLSHMPGVSLMLGFAGAGAVITVALLLARSGGLQWLRYCGQNSIVIYLAFFLFMAATRTLGLKLLPGINVDVLALATTAAGVAGPVLLFWATRHTALAFLFKRPAWARLNTADSKGMETAATGWHTAGHEHSPFAQHAQIR